MPSKILFYFGFSSFIFANRLFWYIVQNLSCTLVEMIVHHAESEMLLLLNDILKKVQKTFCLDFVSKQYDITLMYKMFEDFFYITGDIDQLHDNTVRIRRSVVRNCGC